MAITQIDEKTALIVIDLQNGIVALPPKEEVPGVIKNTNALIKAFYEASQSVVLVNVAGGAPGRTDNPVSSHPPAEDWVTLIDELHRDEREILVTKRTWGAFSHSDLDQQLKFRGVTQVVIVGIATSIGVESTARQAFELGYNVTLCTDAMTDLNLENHAHSVSNIFPLLAETGSTDELLYLL